MELSPDTTFVDDKWLAARYGRHRTAIWRWTKKREFPQPIKIAPGCARWRLDDVLAHERRAADGGE